MAVPSRAEFSSFVDALNVGMVDNADFRAIAEAGVTGITALIDEMVSSKRRLLAQHDAHHVGQWLHACPTSKRAWRSLYGRPRSPPPISHREIAQRWIDFAFRDATEESYDKLPEYLRVKRSCAAYLEEHNADTAKLARLERVIQRRATIRPFGVACEVAQAFSGYFYADSFLSYSATPRARKEAATELLAAWSTLTDESKWQAAMVEPVRVSLPKSALDGLRTVVSGSAQEWAIKKMDATARERALAFELWSVARRRFRANKTTAILNFLQFDGVENVPDARSVERWVADWRSRKVAIAPVHSNQKHRLR